jgi:peptidoglycan/xylan/chitin deacetylase (PgdA/CDA1 family)
MMYFHKTPRIIRAIAQAFTWRIPEEEKAVYLTFDDGPTPIITEKTLAILATYHAKATFFCIGKNVVNHPQILQAIQDQGHHIGNHTFQHLDGWKTGYAQYIRNALQAKKMIPSTLFRPPYGHITRTQTKALEKHFQLIMWDVLAGDFDPKMSVERCIEKVVSSVQPGSIVVFHDSMKASPVMLQALPIILNELQNQGYQFKPIPYHVR